MSYQFFAINAPVMIEVTKVFKGTSYNDTCIAEFNFYIDQYSWLFGEIDE